MSEFYIMNATQALHNKNKVGIEAIVAEMAGSEGTIYVCEREQAWGKFQKVFVSSYGSVMQRDCGLPWGASYTEDTGNGYRNKGKGLGILNVVQKSKDGVTTSVNHIGMGEKLPHWVCK